MNNLHTNKKRTFQIKKQTYYYTFFKWFSFLNKMELIGIDWTIINQSSAMDSSHGKLTYWLYCPAHLDLLIKHVINLIFFSGEGGGNVKEAIYCCHCCCALSFSKHYFSCVRRVWLTLRYLRFFTRNKLLSLKNV